jgi:hypothetical protein
MVKVCLLLYVLVHMLCLAHELNMAVQQALQLPKPAALFLLAGRALQGLTLGHLRVVQETGEAVPPVG